MSSFTSPYPDYDVLAKWDTPSWNAFTREVIARRLTEVPKRQFLPPDEYAILEAACDRLLPQPERTHPVPIAPWIDQKLVNNQDEGYRYADLPPFREAWQRGLQGIDDESRQRYGMPFVHLSEERQDGVLRALQQGDTQAPLWQQLPAKRFFSGLLLTEVVAVYYAYPAAWNEIGFGGPASPRGYVRLAPDRRDPWEAKEHHD
jgi:hypothetical protein